MSCINPLKLQISGEWVNVSCGKCQNCIIKKKENIEFLAKKEAIKCYERGQGCSFTTLTYNEENLPISKDEKGNPHITLIKKDVSDFIKRVRADKSYYKDKMPLKILYCGEYGRIRGRSHYHIINLGLTDVEAEKYTRKKWSYGLCDNGPLGAGGIRYCTDYMQKAQLTSFTKLKMEALKIEPPFLHHSINLGKEWIIENEEEIIDNGFTYVFRGKRRFYPKYIRDFVAGRNGIRLKEEIQRCIKEKWKCAENWQQLELEESLLKEKFLIDAARSKGNMIKQWQTAEPKWLKPKSRHDRQNWKPLIEEILKL